MLDTLFGQMPLALKFFMVFLVILAVIAAIAWALRRFGSGRLGVTTRGRQPRLAVIDYATVDSRRRLILVRRDNVEHLLMIGGPGDVVVEPNIVRATASPRDMARGPAGIDALPRAIPLPDSGASWPLQPETNGAARPRLEHYPDELPGRPSPPESPPRHRDTLAALADELSGQPAAPRVPLRSRPSITEPQKDHRAEPRLEPRRPAVQAPVPPSAPPPASVAAPPPAEGPVSADQNLADMAQRLEAALRKSNSDGRPPVAPPRAIPMQEAAARADAAPPPRMARAPEARPELRPEPRPEPRPEVRPEPRPEPRPELRSEPRMARPEAKPNQNKTAIYDTLEQEMANLLGRPGKS
jgi:flagellar protein FliO/FliZ